ncbi:MAG TPA: A/G-specific adenine glycosylase [Actinomycetota bacterium]
MNPRTHARVLDWFDSHGRPFPWRENRDPYRTLVAEVMLQQTQTGRVGPSYESFLKSFPTVRSLAHAPAMEVIRAWRGLGYNKRAVNLQQAAQVIEAVHGGEVPDDPAALRTLPGVGEYTANAVACFAFDRQVPVVDVNVERVLARAALGKEPGEAPKDAIRDAARAWLPAGQADRWNQALMDVGAMICRIDAPLCAKCPLKTVCRAKAGGRPGARAPAKKAEPFEGSRRQKRGGIVDALRDAASDGISLRALGDALHPSREDRDLMWLVELLHGLEADGLVELTPGARRGSPRGVVRLPG